MKHGVLVTGIVALLGVVVAVTIGYFSWGHIDRNVIALAAIPWVTALVAMIFSAWQTPVLIAVGRQQLDEFARRETTAWINVSTQPTTDGSDLHYLVLRNQRMGSAHNVTVRVLDLTGGEPQYKLHSQTDKTWPVKIIGPQQEVWLLSDVRLLTITVRVSWSDEKSKTETAYTTVLGQRMK